MIKVDLYGKSGMMHDDGMVHGDELITDLLKEYKSMTRTYMGDVFYAMAGMIQPHYPMAKIYVSEERTPKGEAHMLY